MRFLLLVCVLAPWCAIGQELSSVRTRWGDAFVEWDLFVYAPMEEPLEEGEDPPEAPFGEMKLRWLNLRDDFSEWEFQLGDLRGTIRMPWKDDPTQWELRTFDNEVVTMRASWNGDPTEWRVTNNAIALKLGSRWKNQLDEWLVDDPTYGRFYLYTFTEQDPRDWAVQDDLAAEVTPAMKVALIFLTVFHSAPRQ